MSSTDLRRRPLTPLAVATTGAAGGGRRDRGVGHGVGVRVVLRRRPGGGTLDEPGFATAAESVCATTATCGASSPGFETPDATAGAAVVAQANGELDAMLARLAELTPGTDRDRTMVAERLGDWRT